MSKFKSYTTNDFIKNTSFIKWVLKSDDADNQLWQKYISDHPEQKENIDEGVSFIRSIAGIEAQIPHDRIEMMWKNISTETKKSTTTFFYRLRYVAAVLILAISVFSVSHLFKENKVIFDNSNQSETVQLILSNGAVKSIDGNSSKISQKADGTIVANADTIKPGELKKVRNEMNRLVVPYGKRTDLYLSDGTHIYVNSGSKIAFPSVFEGNTREIYLSGEAFCEVKSDKKHPFIIHTDEVDVKVTGTAFNIQAYKNELVNQTVLVRGEVTLISKNGMLKERVIMKPGESASMLKSTGDFTVNPVETEQYTSWIYGYLILKHQSVDYILRNLERYYNKQIVYDANLKELTFSGKLDLNENIDDVLETIAFASTIKIKKKNNLYIIKK